MSQFTKEKRASGTLHSSELASQTVEFVKGMCLKEKFYAIPLNFFKIARTSFGVIIFQNVEVHLYPLLISFR